MEAKIQAVLEKYSDDQIISVERIPAIAFELAQLVKPNTKIADNMRDHWMHVADGAEPFYKEGE